MLSSVLWWASQHADRAGNDASTRPNGTLAARAGRIGLARPGGGRARTERARRTGLLASARRTGLLRWCQTVVSRRALGCECWEEGASAVLGGGRAPNTEGKKCGVDEHKGCTPYDHLLPLNTPDGDDAQAREHGREQAAPTRTWFGRVRVRVRVRVRGRGRVRDRVPDP